MADDAAIRLLQSWTTHPAGCRTGSSTLDLVVCTLQNGSSQTGAASLQSAE